MVNENKFRVTCNWQGESLTVSTDVVNAYIFTKTFLELCGENKERYLDLIKDASAYFAGYFAGTPAVCTTGRTECAIDGIVLKVEVEYGIEYAKIIAGWNMTLSTYLSDNQALFYIDANNLSKITNIA